MVMLDDYKQESPKDRYGRYLITGADGKQRGYTRVTTIAKAPDDEAAIKSWANRMVITGIVARPDLLAQASTKLDDKSALNRICDEAITAGGGSLRANLGSALHAVTEQIDLGNQPPILPGLRDDVETYVATLKKLGVGIRREFIETVVINDTLQYAGTLDRIVEVDGKLYIADLKTGANLAYSWRSIAIQLAAYQSAEHIYDWHTGQRTPMPNTDPTRGIVFHLPAGETKCVLYWVDLEAGRDGLQLALNVRAWRKRDDLKTVFASKPADVVVTIIADAELATVAFEGAIDSVRKGWLTARILHLPDPAKRMLRALWPADIPKIADCTDAQLDLIVAKIATVEADHNVPFFDANPTLPKPVPRVRSSAVVKKDVAPKKKAPPKKRVSK